MKLFDSMGNEVTEDYVHVLDLVKANTRIYELEAEVKTLSKKKK